MEHGLGGASDFSLAGRFHSFARFWDVVIFRFVVSFSGARFVAGSWRHLDWHISVPVVDLVCSICDEFCGEVFISSDDIQT